MESIRPQLEVMDTASYRMDSCFTANSLKKNCELKNMSYLSASEESNEERNTSAWRFRMLLGRYFFRKTGSR